MASAYQLLGDDIGNPTTSIWDNIWAMKGPCRLNFLLWQLCHQIIPVGRTLREHHIDASYTCRVCNYVEEDILHSLRDCHWPNQLRRLLVHRLHFPTFCSFNDPASWVSANLQNAWGALDDSLEWRYVFREAVMSIWYWKNQKAHGCITQFPLPSWVRDEILCRVNKLLLTHRTRNTTALCDVDT